MAGRAGKRHLEAAGLSLTDSNYTIAGGSGTAAITPLAVPLTGSQVYNATSSILAPGLTLTDGVLGATASSNPESESITTRLAFVS